MAAAGLALLFALAGGPIRLAGRQIDFHLMFVGSLLAILGTQVAMLGVFATSDKHPPAWFTLERGLAAGLGSIVAGLAVNLYILVEWIQSGFGPLNAIRPGIIGLTLIAIGAQLLFSSFYLDLVRADSDEPERA